MVSKKILLLSSLLFCSVGHAELPNDTVPKVLTLPQEHGESWLYVQDMNFWGMTEGKVIILDIASASHNYKGQVSTGFFGSFIPSTQRNEMYSAETYYARGTRGARTDVLSIWDNATLTVTNEIELPHKKRAQTVSEKNATQLIDDDKYLLVFNFTPATSVSVVDMLEHKVLSEIDIPGCSLIYPSGKRGFSTLCADGSMLSIQLDEKGTVASETRVPSFFNVDEDPLFEKYARITDIGYFPTFHGYMQPVDLSGAVAKPLEKWDLLTPSEREQNWRPGGWQIISGHPDGQVFILMHKDGVNGSHKDGGTEVWVYDIKQHKKVKTIPLNTHGISLEVTKGNKPLLAVTNANMMIDVYNIQNAELQRTLSIGGDNANPFTLTAVE
ncbi:amine dehydrogenase large subunit [Paraglaciecola sp. 20A4]|uniref:amine dehydrogenase large subunit n=1 Tax=Paraglaciecola sp. 20A4 TaxID=2687288 RepID=UPI001408BA24|nr:amine dehydrogenase large subunit [Paraglaciecola sp. 20A4]|tara:strand:- start:7662 stop:8813 length:1152 start_codon:yes stop_codon:yes gene_type:complete